MNKPLPKAGPDFLQRLVRKALNEESAIEPRLPSIFEPVSGASLEGGFSWHGASAQIADAASEGRAAGQVEAARGLRPGAGRGPIFGHGGQGEATASGDFAPDLSARQPDLWPAVSHVRDDGLRMPVAAPHGRVVEAEMRRSPAAPPGNVPRRAPHFMTQEPHSFGGGERPAAARRSMDGRDPLPADPGGRAGLEERADRPAMSDGSDGALVPLSAVALQRIVLALPTAPYRPMRDEVPADQPAAPAEPIVNVTIGRLEVRAAPLAAATAKPRSERGGPQPMTLDEYLRQQQGKR